MNTQDYVNTINKPFSSQNFLSPGWGKNGWSSTEEKTQTNLALKVRLQEELL
jgi:hypothetical protein